MSGYIDFHTHLLPGFDDGAGHADESLEILAHAHAAGFRTVLVTPHYVTGTYVHERAEVEAAIAELAPAIAERAPGLTLVPGSEYYLDDMFFGMLADGALRPIGRGNHVLVELPFVKLPPLAKDFAFRIRIKGLVPVLAHPERISDVARKPELAEDLENAGFRLQVNLGSLTGMYGRHSRKAAEWLLKRGVAEFVGSDAHTPRQAAETYGEGMAALTDLLDEPRRRRLLIDNPAAVIAGEQT